MTNKSSTGSTNRKLSQLHSWYASRLATGAPRQILSDLQVKLSTETLPEFRQVIYSMAIAEHIRDSDSDGAISVARLQVDEFSQQPLAWITLAECLLSQSSDAKPALDAIDKAIEVARLANKYRRQSLQTKARILRSVGDYPGLEKCLSEIISEPRSVGVDVAKEDDFLIGLPPNVISPEVEQSYRNYMQSS